VVVVLGETFLEFSFVTVVVIDVAIDIFDCTIVNAIVAVVISLKYVHITNVIPIVHIVVDIAATWVAVAVIELIRCFSTVVNLFESSRVVFMLVAVATYAVVYDVVFIDIMCLVGDITIITTRIARIVVLISIVVFVAAVVLVIIVIAVSRVDVIVFVKITACVVSNDALTLVDIDDSTVMTAVAPIAIFEIIAAVRESTVVVAAGVVVVASIAVVVIAVVVYGERSFTTCFRSWIYPFRKKSSITSPPRIFLNVGVKISGTNATNTKHLRVRRCS